MIGLASTAAYFFVLQLIATVLARYSRDLGIDIMGTALMWSVISVIALVLRPLAGYFADKTSSFMAMALGGVFVMISSLAYMGASGLSDLVIGRIIQGVGSAFFISQSMVAVAVAADGYAGMALGIRSMLVALSGLIAPPIAGFIADALGYDPIFIISASIAVIIILLNGWITKSSIRIVKRPGEKGGWREAINPVVIILMGAIASIGVTFMALTGLLQAHYRDLGYEAKIYGYFMMFYGISSILSRYIAGKASLKQDPIKIAMFGYVISVIAMFLLGFFYLAPLSYILAILYGFGTGFIIPVQQLIAVSSVPDTAKNRAMAIYAMGWDVGGFLGPLTYGYLASLYGYEFIYPWLALPLLIALGLLVILKILKSKRGF